MQQTKAFKLIAFAVIAAISSLLLAWSQTHAYVGDESFHLLAAKLIAAGKTPYVDFFYQHPPFFAYVMAGLFRLTGAGWRGVHALSAICTIGTIVLAIAYSRRFHESQRDRWLHAAIVAVFIGVNSYVLIFATNGLPFGFCLVCIVAALYCSALRTRRGSLFCGLFVSAGAASSLLVSPLVVVFVVWTWFEERERVRWMLLGVIAGALPLLVLLFLAPGPAIDNLIRYHLVDRPKLGWRFNLREIGTWVFTIQSVTLIGFAIAGARTTRERSLRLCIWASIALAVFLALIRTTTAFYFVVLTPFLAILASVAITALAHRAIVLGALAIYVVGLTGIDSVWKQEAPYEDYRDVGAITRAAQLCAPSGHFYADEAAYFEAATLPPPHMENRFDPKSAGDAALAAGSFDAVVIRADNPKIQQYDLNAKYNRRMQITRRESKFLLFCGRVSAPR